MTRFAVAVENNRDWQEQLYLDLHRSPELSMQEEQTAQRLERELADLGLESERIGGTGVVSVVENGDGPVVLLRADTDGLPVVEESGADYASTNGRMHACGHDTHMSSLMGAIKVLAEDRDAWSGTVIACFQPAEETAEGAKAMVADDIVSKIPRPDVAYGQHVMPGPAGTVLVRSGTMMSQADSLRITIRGRGAHGSMPHASLDPVVAASAIVMRLQTVVSRELEPGTFAVVTVGSVQAGGKSNIIPATAELLVNVRTYDPAVRARVLASIERICNAECEASGITEPVTIETYDQFPLTKNDERTTEELVEAFTEAFGADGVQECPRSTGSEDFSIIPDAFGTPYTFWFMGGFDPEVYAKAVEEGTIGQDIPVNHSPFYLPVMQPTLTRMTEAMLVAAMSQVGKD